MLFTVLLFVCSFIDKFDASSSAIEKLCTTANGTQGSCVPHKHCPTIKRLIGATSPQELEFITSSICGYDLDKSRLFCCDISELKSGAEDSVVSESLAKSIVVPKLKQTVKRKLIRGNLDETPFRAGSPQEPPPSYCQTPSDERAQCLSVYNCPKIYEILQNTTREEVRRYLRESRCGYDNGNVLVCCGTQVNFDYSEESEDSLNFKYNDLLPRTDCGVEEESPENQLLQPTAPRLKRLLQYSNITLKNRIFGGTDTGINEFPWVVLLESNRGPNEKRLFHCGGAIISTRYVLTAAHCISGDRAGAIASVRIGEWNHSNEGQDCVLTSKGSYCIEPAVSVAIESLHPHPDYNDAIRGRYHDIGLVRLRMDLQFTNNIRPICLPNVNDYVPPGEKLTLSGWGLKNFSTENSIKQKVELPVIPKSQCSVMFEMNNISNQIGKGQFCAGGEAGLDACAGDSGGPLMRRSSSTTENPSRWYLEGIVSLGFGCGVENYYGVYTKVSRYIGWIHKTVIQ